MAVVSSESVVEDVLERRDPACCRRRGIDFLGRLDDGAFVCR